MIRLASDRWDHYAAIRTDDLHAMAIELRVGDRHTGCREHDHQRRYACDAFIGGTQVGEAKGNCTFRDSYAC